LLIESDGGARTWAARTGTLTDPVGAALTYIRRRYGSPSKALATFLASGARTYHTGGWVEGLSNVPTILQGGEYVFSREQSQRMRDGAMVVPTPDGNLQVVEVNRSGGGAPQSLSADAVNALTGLAKMLENRGLGHTFNVHPAPKMDERDLAMKVSREVAWNDVPR
jgi:hypothetical protein